MNSRGSATQEPTPGKPQRGILPRRGSPIPPARGAEMGLPLRGREDWWKCLPGVKTPGYSWGNRAAVLNMQDAVGNYGGLLMEMGDTEAGVREKIGKIMARVGHF